MVLAPKIWLGNLLMVTVIMLVGVLVCADGHHVSVQCSVCRLQVQ